jgi:hypothetical protein
MARRCVTGRIFQNGVQKDAVTLPGTNASIVARSVDIPGVLVGDLIDIVLDPMGFSGGFGNGGDRCLVSAVIHGHPSLTSQIAGDIEGAMRHWVDVCGVGPRPNLPSVSATCWRTSTAGSSRSTLANSGRKSRPSIPSSVDS